MAVAAIAGLGIGWLDLHTTEVTVTILALLVTGGALGLLRPGASWWLAGVAVLGLPVMDGVALLAGMRTAEPVQLDPRVWLVTLVFALVGAGAGALVRRAATPDGPR